MRKTRVQNNSNGMQKLLKGSNQTNLNSTKRQQNPVLLLTPLKSQIYIYTFLKYVFQVCIYLKSKHNKLKIYKQSQNMLQLASVIQCYLIYLPFFFSFGLGPCEKLAMARRALHLFYTQCAIKKNKSHSLCSLYCTRIKLHFKFRYSHTFKSLQQRPYNYLLS